MHPTSNLLIIKKKKKKMNSSTAKFVLGGGVRFISDTSKTFRTKPPLFSKRHEKVANMQTGGQSQ